MNCVLRCNMIILYYAINAVLEIRKIFNETKKMLFIHEDCGCPGYILVKI